MTLMSVGGAKRLELSFKNTHTNTDIFYCTGVALQPAFGYNTIAQRRSVVREH